MPDTMQKIKTPADCGFTFARQRYSEGRLADVYAAFSELTEGEALWAIASLLDGTVELPFSEHTTDELYTHGDELVNAIIRRMTYMQDAHMGAAA